MIIPNDKRILIKELEKKESYGGIVLEGGALMDHSLSYGEVVSETSEKFPKGTKVYFSEYSTARITVNKQELKIIPEIDIMAFEK
jgi:co-chaperonin GroES (HSP10)